MAIKQNPNREHKTAQKSSNISSRIAIRNFTSFGRVLIADIKMDLKTNVTTLRRATEEGKKHLIETDIAGVRIGAIKISAKPMNKMQRPVDDNIDGQERRYFQQ